MALPVAAMRARRLRVARLRRPTRRSSQTASRWRGQRRHLPHPLAHRPQAAEHALAGVGGRAAEGDARPPRRSARRGRAGRRRRAARREARPARAAGRRAAGRRSGARRRRRRPGHSYARTGTPARSRAAVATRRSRYQPRSRLLAMPISQAAPDPGWRPRKADRPRSAWANVSAVSSAAVSTLDRAAREPGVQLGRPALVERAERVVVAAAARSRSTSVRSEPTPSQWRLRRSCDTYAASRCTARMRRRPPRPPGSAARGRRAPGRRTATCRTRRARPGSPRAGAWPARSPARSGSRRAGPGGR